MEKKYLPFEVVKQFVEQITNINLLHSDRNGKSYLAIHVKDIKWLDFAQLNFWIFFNQDKNDIHGIHQLPSKIIGDSLIILLEGELAHKEIKHISLTVPPPPEATTIERCELNVSTVN